MRRLIAYIVLAISMLGLILFNVQDKVENINWSQEYDNGTEVMYNILSDGEINLESVIEELGVRLEEAGATSYKIERAGDKANNSYSIKVSLGSRNSSNIDNILRSTMASGEFSVFTTDGFTINDGTDLIKRGTASYDFNENSQAFIKIDATSELQQVIDYAKETTKNGYLVLWQGKTDDIDFENLADEDFISSESKLTNLQAQEKVLAILDFSESSSTEEEGSTKDVNTKFYQDGDDENLYHLTFGVYGYTSSGASTATFNAASAKSFERLLNSNLINYEITEVYRRTISADYGASAISLMVWCAAIATTVTCLYLLICYGMMAISGCIGIGLTVLFDLIVVNLFNIQLNPVMILALVITLGIAANILCLYYQRTREDAYKGRIISKASNEGFRKTISTAVDSSVMLIISSIVLAVISNTSLQAFSIFFIFSLIFSLLFIFLLGKVLNNFLFGSNLSTKLGLFRINKKYVENLEGVAEAPVPETKIEKINPSKHFKVTGIASLIAIIIAAGSLLGFGLAKNTTIFNYSNEPTYGRVEVRTTDQYLFTSKYNGMYPNGYECASDKTAKDNFIIFIESIDDVKVTKSWTITDQVNPYDAEKNNYLYFYADIDQPLADEKLAILEDFVFSITGDDPEYNTVFVHNYTVDSGVVTYDINNTFVLISVFLGISLVYFVIRYRYSYAIATFLNTTIAAFISVGLLSLIRIPLSGYACMGVLAGIMLTTALLIPLGNRLSQLKNESKVKVTTYEQRKEIANEALKTSIKPIVFLSGLVIVLLQILSLVFMKMAPIFESMAITLIISTLLAIFGVIPLHLWIEEHFKFRKLKTKRAQMRQAKREKIAKQNRNKGAEPEEIIIPGIND